MASITLRAVVALSGLALVCAAQAEQKETGAPKGAAAQTEKVAPRDPVTADFEKFREVMEEASPAELFEAKGEELWKTKRGPKNASLEQCDLGLGPGVLKGAYVRMPRYFADADQVMDAERRIVYCMVSLQGFRAEDLAKQPFSNDSRTPDPVSLVTYVAGQSRGMRVAVPQ
jgi:sulfur-oxidizing protein SoxA